MREILFRGKPKNKKDYELYEGIYKDNCKNGFIYGSLIISEEQYYICLNVPLQENTYRLFSNVTLFEVIPETVGKYTGLKDKNGKMIFEGDIVTYEDAVADFEGYHDDVFLNCGEVGISTWDGIYFTNRQTVDMSDLYESETMVDCEVIGNIHDNPELLEV